MENCKQNQINEGAMTVARTCKDCGKGPCKYGINPLPMHVDQFIASSTTDAYASWFFQLQRMPAIAQSKFAEWIDQYKLFCTYEGNRYRVTGCSRLGDVWLAKDVNQDHGYDHRVNVESCTEFGASFEIT